MKLRRIIGWRLVVSLLLWAASIGGRGWAQDDGHGTPDQARSAAEAAAKQAGAASSEFSVVMPGGVIRASRSGGEMIRVGSSGRVAEGESVRELVVVFGNAAMDGEVRGDMVVVWGDATVNGRVGGDFVNVFGKTTLGPKAKLDGECIVVGTELARDPAAVLSGQPIEVNLGGFMYWLKSGLLLARPIAPGLWWSWVAVAIHFLLYLLIILIAPRPVDVCLKTLDTQLLPSFGAGLVGFILIAPLLTIVAATGIGVLLIPFLILAFLGAVFVGKAALLQYLGGQLSRRLNPDAAQTSLLAFVVGFALVTVIYMVPVLGFVVWGTLPILGLGAAVLAAVQAMRRNGRSPGPVPVPAMAFAGPADPAPVADSSSPVATTDAASQNTVTLPPASIGSRATQAPPVPPVVTASPADLTILPRAGFWIRFAASLLDLVLLGWVFAFLDGFFPLVWLAYHIGMWAWKGTTIGGIVCNLKVVRVDGRDLDFTVALVRGLAAVFSFIALCLGFFWAGWTRERQSWHDLIAGTVIVRVPRSMSLI